MDLASLIISIIAFLMASANLIIYLAKGVFSTHTVQLVPAESIGQQQKAKPIEQSFEEFDMRSPVDDLVEVKKI